MGSIQITLKPEQFAEFNAMHSSDIATAKKNIKRRLQDQGQALVTSKLGRWQTGRLANSLRTYVTGSSVSMLIGEGLDYADAVFFGAPKHWIYPRAGGVLHWNRFGTDFYFKAVEHPGQKARDDILDALGDRALRIAEEEVIAIITARAMSR